jgi:hypothetical protein
MNWCKTRFLDICTEIQKISKWENLQDTYSEKVKDAARKYPKATNKALSSMISTQQKSQKQFNPESLPEEQVAEGGGGVDMTGLEQPKSKLSPFDQALKDTGVTTAYYSALFNDEHMKSTLGRQVASPSRP